MRHPGNDPHRSTMCAVNQRSIGGRWQEARTTRTGPMEGAPMRTGSRQAAAFITRETAMYACPDQYTHAELVTLCLVTLC